MVLCRVRVWLSPGLLRSGGTIAMAKLLARKALKESKFCKVCNNLHVTEILLCADKIRLSLPSLDPGPVVVAEQMSQRKTKTRSVPVESIKQPNSMY